MYPISIIPLLILINYILAILHNILYINTIQCGFGVNNY